MWSNTRLERDCSDDRRASRRFGPERWATLRRRLASLSAAPTLRDLEGVPGKFHPLVGDRAGQFAMTVSASHRLIFVPDHNPVPMTPDGGIDRDQITRVRILEVVDYHGH